MSDQSQSSSIMTLLKSFKWPLALLVVVVIVGIAAPFWNVPLSRDQGVYATCADVILRGGMSFQDCWDTKGPALHYTYALSRLIFGTNSSGPYVLNALAIAATALVIAAIAYLWFEQIDLAYAVGLAYGLLAIIVRFDMNAQPESFANLFGMLGLLGLMLGARREAGKQWYIYLISGALLAVVVLYKYALVLPLGTASLGVIFGMPLDDSQRSFRRRLSIFGLTLGGSLLIMLLSALYLLARGALDAIIEHIHFIFFYFPKAQLNPDEYAFRSLPVQQTLLYFGRLPVIWALGLIGCGVAIWQRRWYDLPLAAYILAGVAIVWIQQRFTPYHWTAVMPALVFSIGALVYEIIHWPAIQQSRWRAAAFTIMGAATLVNLALFFYVDQWQILGGYLTGQTSPEDFFESQGVWDQMVAADYLRERTDPDDPIWVWGHHTAIYYLAERRSPTRYIYNEPLLMRIRGGNPWQAKWRAEALEDIYRDPPVYILLTTFDRTFFDFQNPNDSWRDIPEYSGFTAQYYIQEHQFGRFLFYHLKPYWSRQNDPELLDAVTRIDLIEEFDQAEVNIQPDPPIAVTSFEIIPEPGYDTILMQSEASLSYTLDLPESPVCLRFDIAMFQDSWGWGGDGAAFAVEVESGGENTRMFESYVSNDPPDQHWHDYLVDLSSFGGQTVRLTFLTGAGPNGDLTGDWAGWGMPRIVQPPSGDICDTNAIVDTR